MRLSRFVLSILLVTLVIGSIPTGMTLAATPVKVGKFEHGGRICVEAGAKIDLINAYIPIIGPVNTRNNALDVHDCQAAFAAVEEKFKYAYEVAQDSGIDPGQPTNYVHNWSPAGVVIQDFYSESDGWGAIIWGGATKPTDPHFVGGMTLVEYKESVNERGISPGYPKGVEHDWNGVRIQDFTGGSWGGGGIIGGNTSPHGAWLVAGNHMEAYWAKNGPVTLGNPKGWVYKNAAGRYQQDFERGNITELAGQTWVNSNTANHAEEEPPMPAEFPPVGRQEPTTAPLAPAPVATCNDAGIPVMTTRLSASPQNPDTATQVTLSTTITNNGCGTFAPEVLAIGGRDPSGNVTDPLQDRNFVLAPGESRTISQPVNLSIPGSHEYFMVFLRPGGGWNRIPDASGDTSSIFVTIAQQGEAAPPATCSESGGLHMSSRLNASPQTPDTATEITLTVTLTNSGCGTFAPEVLAIGGRDASGNVTDPLQVRDFVLGPGESKTVTQSVVLSTPGTHEFFMAYLRSGGGWHRIPDASGDSASIFVPVTDEVAVDAPPQENPAVTTDEPTEVPTEAPVTEAPQEGTEVPTEDSATETQDNSIIQPVDGATNAPVQAPPVDSSEDTPLNGSQSSLIEPVDATTDASDQTQTGQPQPPQVQTVNTQSSTVDIALITRDPSGGKLLTGTCYVLVDYSNQGCDENGDGQVTFAQIVPGTYTIRQTRTPNGYPTINDFAIEVTNTPGVPLNFLVRQASEQNAANSRNVSFVFIDSSSRTRMSSDICVEMVGASNIGCDLDLIDGQIDFIDVPVGDWPVSLTNVPAGWQVRSVSGSDYASVPNGQATHIMLFYEVTASNSSSGNSGVIAPSVSQSSQPGNINRSTTLNGSATLVMTMRGCPEGFNPNTGDFFASCTIPLDAPDASFLYHGGDGQGGMNIMWMDRQYDGGYIFNAGPYTMNVSLSGLAPVVRDGYTVIGADSSNGDEYYINLVNGETREVWVFYYYWP